MIEAIDIIEQIEKGNILALDDIPPSHDFWHGMNYLFNPKSIYRFKFVDPKSHGKGVPFEVFDKIYKGMADQSITEEQASVVLTKLSESATQKQWAWYKRILEGNAPNIRIIDYNRFAPEHYKIPLIKEISSKPFENVRQLPQSFLMEPLYSGDLLFWKVQSGYDTTAFFNDGTKFTDQKLFQDIDIITRAKNIPQGIVLETILEGKEIFLRDITTLTQFERKEKTKPFYQRRQILEDLYYKILSKTSIKLTECYEVSSYTNSLDRFNILIEQGFTGFYARFLDTLFWQNRDLLIQPGVEEVCEIVSFVPGQVKSKYDNMVWEIVVNDSKKNQQKVALGLTNDERRTIYRDSSKLIGRKIPVSHCGTIGGSWAYAKTDFKRMI